MKSIARRSFLRQTGTAVAGAAALAGGAPAFQAAGAAERVTVGVIGCSRGASVGREMAKQGANVAYVCDTDEGRMNRTREEFGADHAVTDMRRIFDDPVVDAVIVATPDHWHASAAILACEAGKHVYVEKPCSHNIREGRLMVEAARRKNRVMQVGSQSRSTTVIANGIQLLREGAIGDILVAKAWNSQRRANIGHQQPSDPPAGFHYDLWVGPAPMQPYQSNRHHYTWHWWYDFGTGDVGNDGVHELDIARWGLGVNAHPFRASGHGAKLYFDDDQQFPDTQYVVFEYDEDVAGKPKRTLIYEHRIWSPYTQQGFENGNAFYGKEGHMVLGKGLGWKLYGPKDKLIQEEKGKYSIEEHVADFFDAIRSERRPTADIEIGHGAATLAHLSNVLARTGRGTVDFDPKSEQIVSASDADALVKRTYREGHWAVPKGV